jgi:hypothetical protein
MHLDKRKALHWWLATLMFGGSFVAGLANLLFHFA